MPLAPAFDFQAPTTALLFDQASFREIEFTFKDSAGNVLPLVGNGIRMALFVDASAILLSLTVANGRVVVADTSPNCIVTILATDTTTGTPIDGVAQGTWWIYRDPNGVEDADSYKLGGGAFYMSPLGVV